MPEPEPVGLYVNFMSSFACIKASPNAPITFAMEVEPSVATVPLVLPLPLQPTAAKQLIAVTAARSFTKSLLNVVFFMFVISF